MAEGLVSYAIPTLSKIVHSVPSFLFLSFPNTEVFKNYTEHGNRVERKPGIFSISYIVDYIYIEGYFFSLGVCTWLTTYLNGTQTLKFLVNW